MASSLRSLVPPKIASASAISGAPGAKRMESVLEFYSKLPKGPAPKAASKGLNPFTRYKAAYFEKGKESGAPLLHAIFAIFAIGYTIDYQMHLKHHKVSISSHHT
ncbi:MAG: ATP synthase f chain, mitochondrial precursor [Cyphobasidiales sp. Tagirdzhanova-0007]|nr:MAG: ATP synthase f chain, mitochondrial precursor [Cyphobasidiales sp. Tagirdzhanova-0007]